MEYLFVYGTLLKKITNEMSLFLAQNAEFYNKGYFFGRLYDLGEYPGAILSDNRGEKVFGNIFKLNDPQNVFSVLDDYEEVGEKYPFPNEYRREKVKVYSNCNEKMDAWIYLFNHSVENLTLISSGDYLGFKNHSAL